MNRNLSYRSGGTAAGVVELAAAMRMFYTQTIGSPDLLFTTLLSSAREAINLTTASAARGEPDSRPSGLPSEIYLAGTLLCDGSFAPVRIAPDCTNYYTLNLVKGYIQLRTEVCTMTAGRSCLFGVTLQGSILGGDFLLLNTNTKSLLATIAEELLQKPNFFREELPRLAGQVGSQQVQGVEESSSLVDQAIELRVVIPLKTGPHGLVVKKSKAANQAEVFSVETGKPIGAVGLGCLRRLIQAGSSRMKTSSFLNGASTLSCFLELLPIIIQGSDAPPNPEPTAGT